MVVETTHHRMRLQQMPQGIIQPSNVNDQKDYTDHLCTTKTASKKICLQLL